MKRRDFILSAAAGVGLVSYSAYYFLSDIEYDPVIAQPQSLSLIWNNEKIRAIGNEYREKTPDESGERALVKLLNTGSSPDERVATDFQTGNTVVVDGWILSLTEARQCALASTIESK